MDPVTHSLAGLAVGCLSGQGFSLTNPIYLGSLLGALAPDLDIVLHIKGQVPYLRYHRGPSHGLLGLAILSLGISLILGLFFPDYSLPLLFFWSFMGALSHTLLDILNSHGARLLWPFSNGRTTLNLLTIFDPVVFILLLGVIGGQAYHRPAIKIVAASFVFSYLLMRWLMARRIRLFLRRHFAGEPVEKITILPAMLSLWNWSILLETPTSYIIGEVRFFSLALRIWHHLAKPQSNPLVKRALASKLGHLFADFTPLFHISCLRENNRDVVRFLDLRYYIRDSFLHSATLVFDGNQRPLKAHFHPYRNKEGIKVVI